MQTRGVPVVVVSGGLDFYIEAVLSREGLRLPFLSDRLTVNGGGRPGVLHPFGHPTCRLCGICEAQVVRSPASRGADGLHRRRKYQSLWSRGGRPRLARHRLKAYPEGLQIPFIPFEDFNDERCAADR